MRALPFWLRLPALALTLQLAACGDTPSTENDADGDGIEATSDCDDTNAAISPNAAEVCDSIDNNCNGEIDENLTYVYYADLDGDAFGDPGEELEACDAPEGYVQNDFDCNDDEVEINPNAREQCNGVDDDCDDDSDEGFDKDDDGYVSCEVGSSPADCDDDDPKVNPKAKEVCDGLDNNCDGEVGSSSVDEDDDDHDGALNCADCADADPAIYPDASEICDGVDNDCDNVTDEEVAITFCPDLDGDGHGDASQASSLCTAPPEGYISTCDDCDDANASSHPGAIELCNGLDDDCSGAPDDNELDADGDGFRGCSDGVTAIDCDDTEPSAYPGATDLCDDGIDQDCSGAERTCPGEDNDGDGYSEDGGDCDDADPDSNPGELEVCSDGIDNDCDGESEGDEAGSGDREPNDSRDTAIDLGTLDTTTTSCLSYDGLLSSTDDADYYKFYSLDQATDDWKISAVVEVPAGVTYCVDLIDESGALFSETVCATGPGQADNVVEFVPTQATGYYWVRVYAEGAVSCDPYELTACGF